MSEASSNRHEIAAFDQERRIRPRLQGASGAINNNSVDIEWLAQTAGERIGEVIESSVDIEGPIPYGPIMIPFRLLNRFSNGGIPVIPDSEAAIDSALEDFWPGNFAFPLKRQGRRVKEEVEQTWRGSLRRMLLAMATDGEPTDSWTRALKSLVGSEIIPEQWQLYEAVHTRQTSDGGRYTLDEISQVPLANFDFHSRFGIFQHAIGRHKNFLYTSATDNLFMPVLARIRMPIGPYGAGLARKLLRTAVFMSVYDEQDYDFRNDAVTAENYRLIAEHTTRANGYDTLPVEDSFVAGLREADEQALPMIITLLTSSQVESYDRDKYDELVKQIIHDELHNELALLARQGLVGSAAVHGTFIPDLVAVKPDGHLKISSQGRDALQALQEISDADGAETIRAYQKARAEYNAAYKHWLRSDGSGEMPIAPRQLIRTWGACPFAGLVRLHGLPQPGAISRRGGALLAVYKHMSPEPADVHRPSWDEPLCGIRISSLIDKLVVQESIAARLAERIEKARVTAGDEVN